MKNIISSILLIYFTSIAFGQKIISKSVFDNIQYVESVEWYDDDIYCAGYSFKTKLNDGNSTDAYLINYDKNLNPKWTLKIDEEHSNIIYSIKRYKDRIYALVTQGNVKPLERDTFISLFIINLEGVILDKISFGRTFYNPSNIVVIDEEYLVFGHRANEGTSYSSKYKSEIIKYNIKTENITRQVNEERNYIAKPKKIIARNDIILLFWSYINGSLPNIMMINKGKYSDISLNSNKFEYYIDSYLQDNIITVISVHPATYEDKSEYLKIYKVNIDDKVITSKILSYEELGFNEIRFDSFTTDNNMIWAIIESNKKELNYVLIDDKGEKIKTTKYDRKNGNGYNDHFILKNQKLLSANSSGIYLYEIE